MMFMIPMPATSSENAAATTRMMVMVSMVELIVLIISSCERMVKSSSAPEAILWLVLRICVTSSMALSVISSFSAEQLILLR